MALFYNPHEIFPRGTNFLFIKEPNTRNDPLSKLNRRIIFRLNMKLVSIMGIFSNKIFLSMCLLYRNSLVLGGKD
ncbi:MAG: hypothetical protein ACXAEX_09000 [Promethearchaeota archaeon]